MKPFESQTFHALITLKKVERDAGVSPAALLYAWYMRNMFVQFPWGSSFIGSLRGLWFMESCIVGPRRRESISLSNSSCRSSSSALLRFDLDAILNFPKALITKLCWWLYCWLDWQSSTNWHFACWATLWACALKLWSTYGSWMLSPMHSWSLVPRKVLSGCSSDAGSWHFLNHSKWCATLAGIKCWNQYEPTSFLLETNRNKQVFFWEHLRLPSSLSLQTTKTSWVYDRQRFHQDHIQYVGQCLWMTSCNGWCGTFRYQAYAAMQLCTQDVL